MRRLKLYNKQPRGFLPAGEVTSVQFSPTAPSFAKLTKVKGKRARGIRYEQKAQEHLLNIRPLTYVPSPWLKFKSSKRSPIGYANGWRWCQPDGLDIDINSGLITIVEFKLSHTANAWWQTRELYEPVVKKLFPPSLWQFSIVEIVKWFDPDTYFPEEFHFIRNLRFQDTRPGRFHLHIWSGR